MSQSAQWFLDVQYWCGLGEVIAFSSYREARQACQELVPQVTDYPDWLGTSDLDEEERYAGKLPEGFTFAISGVELSDEDGYRVSGYGHDGHGRVDEKVDARLWEGLPFIVGKYRIRWLDRGDTYTREAGWPEGAVRSVQSVVA